MRNLALWLCLSAHVSFNVAVQHKTSRSDVFDMLADMAEDSGLPTNLLEDFSMSSLAAKIPFLQRPQQYQQYQQYQQQQQNPSGGPLQYIQNLAPLGLGQLLGGILGSTAATPPNRPGVYTQYPSTGGDTSLMSALSSIAKYDDLKCVPRLLCEVAAGGRPGEKQQAFGGRNTVLSLLSLIGGDMTSPVVVFGRAMLLGLTVQGDPGTCYSAYPSCPRDQNRLVDYLNNHRGGIFRFFSATGLPAYYTQQYSQARIQTSSNPQPSTRLTPPRVSINTDKGHRHLLPQEQFLTHKTLPHFDSRPSSMFQKPLTFPGDRNVYLREQHYSSLPEVENTPLREQHFAFPDRARAEKGSEDSYISPINPSIHRLPPPAAVLLPDRTGTGDLRLDNDEGNFGSTASALRHRRDVRGSSGLNNRMVFPLEDVHRINVVKKMRYPSDTNPSGSNSVTEVQWHLKQSFLKDGNAREQVKFPNLTDEWENRQGPKRLLMRFPSVSSFGGNAPKVSLNSEDSKNKKSTRGMKFPVEDPDQNGNLESDIQSNISKVRFQNSREGSTTKELVKFPSLTDEKDEPKVFLMKFPSDNSLDGNAEISFNFETSNKKRTRGMKFPVEDPDPNRKLESNYIKPNNQNDISKVRFQNSREGSVTKEVVKFPNLADERENSHDPETLLMKFPSDNSLDGNAKIFFNSNNKKSTRGMKFPVEDIDQSTKLESTYTKTIYLTGITKVKFQNSEEIRETSTNRINFPHSGVKGSSNGIRFLENTG